MNFRLMNEDEKETVYQIGFVEWGKDKTWEEYIKENEMEESDGGVRYVLEDDGQIVGSLVVFEFDSSPTEMFPVYGIASVVVPTSSRGKGYGLELMKHCLHHYKKNDSQSIFVLYSDIHPSFYQKIGFISLPKSLQFYFDTTRMVHCAKKNYPYFLREYEPLIREYF